MKKLIFLLLLFKKQIFSLTFVTKNILFKLLSRNFIFQLGLFRAFLVTRCEKLKKYLQEFKLVVSPHGQITTSYWYDFYKAKRVTYKEYCIIIVLEMYHAMKKFKLYDEDALTTLDDDDLLTDFHQFFKELKPANRNCSNSDDDLALVPGLGLYHVWFLFVPCTLQ